MFKRPFRTCLVLLGAICWSPLAAQDINSETPESKYFEPPVRLLVGKVPLNVKAKQMYPSPGVYDVDGDGQLELIVGDIFGRLTVYEIEKTSSTGEPLWRSYVPLKAADGSNIKVSNW